MSLQWSRSLLTCKRCWADHWEETLDQLSYSDEQLCLKQNFINKSVHKSSVLFWWISIYVLQNKRHLFFFLKTVLKYNTLVIQWLQCVCVDCFIRFFISWLKHITEIAQSRTYVRNFQTGYGICHCDSMKYRGRTISFSRAGMEVEVEFLFSPQGGEVLFFVLFCFVFCFTPQMDEACFCSCLFLFLFCFLNLTGGWIFFYSKITISPPNFGVGLIFFFFFFLSLNSGWNFWFQKTSMPPGYQMVRP